MWTYGVVYLNVKKVKDATHKDGDLTVAFSSVHTPLPPHNVNLDGDSDSDGIGIWRRTFIIRCPDLINNNLLEYQFCYGQ